jgi:threonine/homoserine/homoserine lactone efflux protein
MPLSTLLTFLGASVVLTIAPGPDNIFVVTQEIMFFLAFLPQFVTPDAAWFPLLHVARRSAGLGTKVKGGPADCL